MLLLQIYFIVGLVCISNTLGTDHIDYLVEASPEGSDINPKIHNFENILNITTELNKKASLPCFVETNRKFIWMHTGRDEIISIATTIINGNRRLQIESKCMNTDSTDLTVRRGTSRQFRNSIFKKKKQTNGCWKNLVIDQIRLEDEGVYICQIDTMSSARVYLNVLVPPYLDKSLVSDYDAVEGTESSLGTSLTAVEGSDIDLYCNAGGKPTPIVNWYLTKNINTENNLLTESPVLKLKNLTRHSHKRYECVAQNGVHPSLSRTFTINILFKPTIRKLEINNHCVNKPKSIVVGCHVNGSPAPKITWHVNGSQLFDDNPFLSKKFKFKVNKIKGLYSNVFSKLEIQAYESKDLQQRFECSASNNLGTETIKVDLCSKKKIDTKSYFYSRHSKSYLNHHPQTSLNFYSNDTYHYSRYQNSSALREVTAADIEAMMNNNGIGMTRYSRGYLLNICLFLMAALV